MINNIKYNMRHTMLRHMNTVAPITRLAAMRWTVLPMYAINSTLCTVCDKSIADFSKKVHTSNDTLTITQDFLTQQRNYIATLHKYSNDNIVCQNDYRFHLIQPPEQPSLPLFFTIVHELRRELRIRYTYQQINKIILSANDRLKSTILQMIANRTNLRRILFQYYHDATIRMITKYVDKTPPYTMFELDDTQMTPELFANFVIEPVCKDIIANSYSLDAKIDNYMSYFISDDKNKYPIDECFKMALNDYNAHEIFKLNNEYDSIAESIKISHPNIPSGWYHVNNITANLERFEMLRRYHYCDNHIDIITNMLTYDRDIHDAIAKILMRSHTKN